jgi:hypothetical protein
VASIRSEPSSCLTTLSSSVYRKSDPAILVQLMPERGVALRRHLLAGIRSVISGTDHSCEHCAISNASRPLILHTLRPLTVTAARWLALKKTHSGIIDKSTRRSTPALRSRRRSPISSWSVSRSCSLEDWCRVIYRCESCGAETTRTVMQD